MTRAGIYEYITYYTERTAEDIKTLKDYPSMAKNKFYHDRIKDAMDIIQHNLEKLKEIDKEERKENESIARYLNKWYNVKTVKERK